MARTDYSGRDHHPIPLNHAAEKDSCHRGEPRTGRTGTPTGPVRTLKGFIMMEYFRSLLPSRRIDDETGASAVEYGLLVAGIAALIVAVVFIFGGMISDTFNDTCGKISSGTTNADGTVDDGATCQ